MRHPICVPRCYTYDYINRGDIATGSIDPALCLASYPSTNRHRFINCFLEENKRFIYTASLERVLCFPRSLPNRHSHHYGLAQAEHFTTGCFIYCADPCSIICNNILRDRNSSFVLEHHRAEACSFCRSWILCPGRCIGTHGSARDHL